MRSSSRATATTSSGWTAPIRPSRVAARSRELDETASFVAARIDEPGLAGRVRGEGGPRLVYARFFVHAITEAEEVTLLDLAAAIADPGDLFAVEYRTIRDSSGAKVTAKHFRRFVMPAAFEARALARGFDVTYSVEGFGFAKYRQDDAYVARTLFRRHADEHRDPTLTASGPAPDGAFQADPGLTRLVRVAAEEFANSGSRPRAASRPRPGRRRRARRACRAAARPPAAPVDRDRRPQGMTGEAGASGPDQQPPPRRGAGPRTGGVVRLRRSEGHARRHGCRPSGLARRQVRSTVARDADPPAQRDRRDGARGARRRVMTRGRWREAPRVRRPHRVHAGTADRRGGKGGCALQPGGQELLELVDVIVRANYERAHRALPPRSRCGARRWFQDAVNEALLPARGLEWTVHGARRPFRLWTDAEQTTTSGMAHASWTRSDRSPRTRASGSGQRWPSSGITMTRRQRPRHHRRLRAGRGSTIADGLQRVERHLSGLGYEVSGSFDAHRHVRLPGRKPVDVFVGLFEGDSISWYPAARGALTGPSCSRPFSAPLLGVTCPIPAQPEVYLERMYGSGGGNRCTGRRADPVARRPRIRHAGLPRSDPPCHRGRTHTEPCP